MAKYIVQHGIRIASDFVPETFGRLTTIGPAFRVRIDKIHTEWKQVCQCSCGAIRVVNSAALRSGNTSSCGCYRADQTVKANKKNKTKHGEAGKSPEYSSWRAMICRCQNENNIGFHNYGGRGITVCPQWLDSETGFEQFLLDMGRRPSMEHTIDRYPNKNGNYEPGNCRWADQRTQDRNKRTNRLITAFGKTQTLIEWAEETGIGRTTITYRLNTGWDVEKALTKPNRATLRRRDE